MWDVSGVNQEILRGWARGGETSENSWGRGGIYVDFCPQNSHRISVNHKERSTDSVISESVISESPSPKECWNAEAK